MDPSVSSAPPIWSAFVSCLTSLMLVSCSSRPVPVSSTNNVFEFGWKAPLHFQVEETVDREGTTNKILHTFSLTETNGEFQLRWLDARFLLVNGASVNAEMETALAPVRMIFLANPPMRISREGEFLGTLYTKEAIEEMNKQLDKAFPNRPEDARQSFAKMADNPEGQKMVATTLSQRYWSPWVEAWLGLELVSGQSLTNDSLSSVGDSQFPAKVVISNLGSSPDNPKQIHLRYEQTANGKQVGCALIKFVNTFSSALSLKQEQPLPELTNANYLVALEVQTDPVTLQPSWAKRVVRMNLDGPETGNVELYESYEFKFIWKTN